MNDLVETDKLTAAVRIRETFNFLYLHQRILTAGQLEFIRGCKKYFTKYKTLSEKQMKILSEIMKWIPEEKKMRHQEAGLTS